MMNYKCIVLSVMLLCAIKIEAAADSQAAVDMQVVAPCSQDELNDELLKAIAACDVQRVGRLIDAGADMNKRHGPFDSPPLYYAVAKSSFEVVDLMLSKGIDVNATCDCGTVLHVICFSRRPDIAPGMMSRLLKAGADPNVKDTRFNLPPLFDAIYLGNTNAALSVAFQLLAAGADKSVKDIRGRTVVEVIKDVCSGFFTRLAPVEYHLGLADLIESFSERNVQGSNLQACIISLFAKNYLNTDASRQEKIERDIQQVSAGCYVDLFYVLIGKERPAVY